MPECGQRDWPRNGLQANGNVRKELSLYQWNVYISEKKFIQNGIILNKSHFPFDVQREIGKLPLMMQQELKCVCVYFNQEKNPITFLY